MFTLIRPISALLMAVFAAYCAKIYEPLYAPGADLGAFPLWAAGISAVVGWLFLGRSVGGRLWMSLYMGVQTVALSALVTAMVLAVREVFTLGYRRRYGEVMEAVTGYFDIITGWLGKAMERDFLILLGVGGLVIGLLAHLFNLMLERRRNAR